MCTHVHCTGTMVTMMEMMKTAKISLLSTYVLIDGTLLAIMMIIVMIITIIQSYDGMKMKITKIITLDSLFRLVLGHAFMIMMMEWWYKL